MEALFDFFIGNFVLIVFIFGVISSLLNYMKERVNENRSRGDRMPSLGDGDSQAEEFPHHDLPYDDWDPEPDQSTMDQTFDPTDQSTMDQPFDPIDQPAMDQSFDPIEYTQPIETEDELLSNEPPPFSGEGVSKMAPRTQEKGTSEIPKHVDEEIEDKTSPVYHPFVVHDLQKKVVEGMMWAEVFGKPRAYRKHTR